MTEETNGTKPHIEESDDESIEELLAKNRSWAENATKQDPEFFSRLCDVQHPEYLWIGCADSRVPANQIIGLKPGEVFVHRNVANLLLHTDLNAISVLQYAVEYLKVKHIIVCGHYGCGGVAAAFDDKYLGVIDHWLGAIKDEYHKHKKEIDGLEEHDRRVDRLCELNVRAQVSRVATTAIVQQAWKRGQSVTIHGWIYSLKDGVIKDLHVPIRRPDQVDEAYRLKFDA